jgi:hypothetical protein
MRVKEDFFERAIEKRRGCGELPTRLQAEPEPIKNSLLHVKKNFKNAEDAVYGPSRAR